MSHLKLIFKTVRADSPILYWIGLILFTGAIVSVPLMFIDERMLMGVNVWVKPFKFFVSTAIYTITVGFLVTLYPFSNLKKHILRNLVSWTMLFELVIISLQAIRGQQSHFNFSTELNASLFSAMGILIGINVLVMVFFAIETIRLKIKTSKVVQWALLLGWVICIFGSWVGGQMISQMAHNVGIPDGGEGLPLLNWSTVGGDLRVAHFFGLHSIQIIPLFAWFLQKNWKTKHRNYVIIVTVFAVLFAGFIFYTYYQASQGKPFIS